MNTQEIVAAYRGFDIVPKRDFGARGYFINGQYVDEGFVVIHGEGHQYQGCNAMPGATWFQTVEQARHGIDCLLEAGDDSERFWKLIRA